MFVCVREQAQVDVSGGVCGRCAAQGYKNMSLDIEIKCGLDGDTRYAERETGTIDVELKRDGGVVTGTNRSKCRERVGSLRDDAGMKGMRWMRGQT